MFNTQIIVKIIKYSHLFVHYSKTHLCIYLKYENNLDHATIYINWLHFLIVIKCFIIKFIKCIYGFSIFNKNDGKGVCI